MKKSIKLLCGLFLVPLTLAGCSGEGDTEPTSTHMQISTPEEFLDFIATAIGEYDLINDIDLGGRSLVPNKFYNSGGRRILHGMNHTVSNFKIEGQQNAALLDKAIKYEFYDLNFDNISVTGTNPALLVSEAENCIFSNITIGANVTIGDGSSDYTGGLVSQAEACTFTGVTNKATVKGGDKVGGVVASAYNTHVEKCSNYGAITGYKQEIVGGVVGHYRNYYDGISETDYKINSLENHGSVTATNSNKVGGVVGAVNRSKHAIYSATNHANSNLTALKNDGDVKGKNYVGGTVGYIDNGIGIPMVSYNENKGSISGEEFVGGIIGYDAQKDVEISQSTNLKNADGTNVVEGKLYVGGIASRVNKVTFSTNEANVRFIKGTPKSSSKDEISDQYGLGGIVGLTFTKSSTIENCTNNGIVEGYPAESEVPYTLGHSIGGVVGLYYGGSFKNNAHNGSVSGAVGVGGLIGSFVPDYETSMSALSVTGKVAAGTSKAGGVIGYVDAQNSDHKVTTMINVVVNSEQLYAYNTFGGIIGWVFQDSSSDSYYEKILLNESNVAGKMYYAAGHEEYCKDIVGNNPISSGSKYFVKIDSSVTSTLTKVELV